MLADHWTDLLHRARTEDEVDRLTRVAASLLSPPVALAPLEIDRARPFEHAAALLANADLLEAAVNAQADAGGPALPLCEIVILFLAAARNYRALVERVKAGN